MQDTEINVLEEAIEKIWSIGESMGLDPFPTHFEIVPTSILYEFGAYALPGRFSHWTHGKAYHQMKTMYDYGLSKIYELVINTDPCYGFLLENNSLLQNKLVVAHVMGHCDFFKNNVWFGSTNRQMVDIVHQHTDRIDRYAFKHGKLVVEEFLDAAIALQEHIDPHVRLKPRPVVTTLGASGSTRGEGPYDDLWRLELRNEPESVGDAGRKVPVEPQKDLLGFIAAHAVDLEPWQRDVLWIVREEMLYFIPQMQTKIMNEGWASMWHARILRELDLTDSEYIEFADLNAGVVSPGSRRQLNPYYVGVKIWEEIIRRWDEPGAVTADLESERSAGMRKAFEVREMENDVSFLRNYLTADLVKELDLYVYRKEGDQWVVADTQWENVRDALVSEMTNMGFPVILVEDANYQRHGELYLQHSFESRELDLKHARETLRHVQKLWGRPVHLETQVDGQRVRLSVDGDAESISPVE